jgi:hypothetical protein
MNESRANGIVTAGAGELSGGTRLHGRQAVENVDKLIHERLAFDAEQKMLEMVLREVRSPAGVTPKRDRGYMLFFRFHKMLDSSRART